jgi:hypothetical protein
MSEDSFCLVDSDDDDEKEDQQNIEDWLSDFQNEVNDDNDSIEGNISDTECNGRDSLDQGKNVDDELDKSNISDCDFDCLDYGKRIPETNDLHLNYGAHISLLKPSIQTSTDNSIDNSISNCFIPSFSLRKGILLSEPDTYKLVIEALLGFSNDIFELSYPQQQFNLSYTARNVYLKETSASSLQMLLSWFTLLATNIQVCRAFAYKNSHSQSSSQSINPTQNREQNHERDANSVYKALRSTTIDLMDSIEAQLCSLDTAVSIVKTANIINCRTEYTLINLYAVCRTWVPLFQSMSALIKTLLHPMPFYISAVTDNERDREKYDNPSSYLTLRIEEKASQESDREDYQKKGDSTRHCSYRNTVTKVTGNKQKEELWTALQCSGIMQGLFAIQRWRRVAITSDPSFVTPSSTRTRALYSKSMITNDVNIASIVTENTSLDQSFKSHLYSTGVLPEVEINSVIELLNKVSFCIT